MNIRKEISTLSGSELQKFRAALTQLQNDTARNNYQFMAGLHGLPNPSNCPHHLPTFLPWHRLYLSQFESLLQRFDPSVTLSYWDWTSEQAIAEGIPNLIADSTVSDRDGNDVNNPLASAVVGFQDRSTSRNPREAGRLRFYADDVATAMAQNIFYTASAETLDFTTALEAPHDSFHDWVRGDMGRVAFSAYDPIFWLHHCNIDRLWAEWQVNNPEVVLPEELLEQSLPFYSQKIRDTLDFKALGITYDTLQVPSGDSSFQPFELDSKIPTKSLRFKQTLLLVNGLIMTKETYELRVFVNTEGDFEPSIDSDNFAGIITLLGMGGAMNPNGFRGEFGRAIDLSSALNKMNADKLESISVRGFNENGDRISVTDIVPNLRFKIEE
ncbi:MAG: tyrosinase family protein [Cyanobacteria bacterium J06623_1]